MSAPSDDTIGQQTGFREIRYRHSPGFVQILAELQATLLLSTYQAGKLCVLSAVNDGLRIQLLHFEQVMGISVSQQQIAVAAQGLIWFFEENDSIAPTLTPANTYDACLLARRAHVTGGIHCHEIAWGRDGELWIVNTLFSCLATLDERHSFVPRWKPPFITELANQDRCHLNGLAMKAGRPKYVTAMAESNAAAGWRPTKKSSGCILDVESSSVISSGLAMPHSPRCHQDELWVLNSGCGALEKVNRKSGLRDVVATVPGYARGLAFGGPWAFVGLSRIRESAIFGGLPIGDRREDLKCGVGVIDVRTGRTMATFEFETGVDEIFDVQLLPNARSAFFCGPRPEHDDAQEIWVVPS